MWSVPPLPRTLEAALRDLDDPSPRVRASSTVDLARHAGDAHARVEGGLLRALRDPAPEVRAAAARSLGDVGAIGAVDALLAAVDDADPLVCQLALEALGEIGGDAARDRVRRALRDPRPELRFQAVMAVAKVAPGDVDAVASAFDDDDPRVRYVALRVAEERVDGAARDALEGPSLPEPCLRAARARLADDRPEVRVAAALLLARAGDRACEPVLLDVVHDRLRTPELEDEAAAVEAVGRLGVSSATPALERRAFGLGRVLRERCSFHARIALALLGHPRARAEIAAETRALLRATRTQAVLAAGRAELVDLRPAIEAMRGRPDRADDDVVEEALAALARAARARCT